MCEVLGHHWDWTNDEFKFDFEKLAEYVNSLNPITKQNILKVTAKMFDSLGIASPVVIRNKILFQKLSKIEWDDTVSYDIRWE